MPDKLLCWQRRPPGGRAGYRASGLCKGGVNLRAEPRRPARARSQAQSGRARECVRLGADRCLPGKLPAIFRIRLPRTFRARKRESGGTKYGALHAGCVSRHSFVFSAACVRAGRVNVTYACIPGPPRTIVLGDGIAISRPIERRDTLEIGSSPLPLLGDCSAPAHPCLSSRSRTHPFAPSSGACASRPCSKSRTISRNLKRRAGVRLVKLRYEMSDHP
ncbi:hypothetical protein C8Q77DRAFT_1117772 [Trametes polyzona]|nr:hypothetical protein C8Q77DRAFT_1117772 [Trametes polyzona]